MRVLFGKADETIIWVEISILQRSELKIAIEDEFVLVYLFLKKEAKTTPTY